MNRIHYRVFLVVVLAFLAAACGSRQHRALELREADSTLRVQPIDCAVEFNGVVDKRRSERLIGPSLHTYEIENLIAYLDNRIDAIFNFGEAAADLTLELRHVYVQGKAMRGFYTIVLMVRLADKPPTVLRGRHDATNWAGASNEFQRGLTAAADQALLGLHNLLSESGLCLPAGNA